MRNPMTRARRRLLRIMKMVREANKPIPHGENKEGRMPTASQRALIRYGKAFLQTFKPTPLTNHYRIHLNHSAMESPLALRVIERHKNHSYQIGQLKLGFEPHAIIIEAIQGAGLGKEGPRAFHAETGVRWDDYLLHIVEDHARKNGYTHVKIRRAEGLYWYTNAAHDPESPEKKYDIQERMKRKYDQTAKRNHYTIENEYWVKRV